MTPSSFNNGISVRSILLPVVRVDRLLVRSEHYPFRRIVFRGKWSTDTVSLPNDTYLYST